MGIASLPELFTLKARSVLLLVAIVAASSLTLAYADKGYDPTWGVGMEREVRSLAAATDGRFLVAGTYADNATTLRAFSSSGLLLWEAVLEGDFDMLSVSGEIVALASGSPIPRLAILSAAGGQNVSLLNLSSSPSALVVDGEEVYVALHSSAPARIEGRPTIYRVQDDEFVIVLELRDVASSLDAKNGTVVAGLRDSTIAVKRSTGQTYVAQVKRPAISVALSADGRYLAAGCFGRGEAAGNVYLFDLAQANPVVPLWNNESENGIGWVGTSGNGEHVAALEERPSSSRIHYFKRHEGATPNWSHAMAGVVERGAVSISPDGTKITAVTLTGDLIILKGDRGELFGSYEAKGGTIVETMSDDGFAAVTRQTPRAAYSVVSIWSYDSEPVILISSVSVPVVAALELAAGATIILFLVRRMD